MMTFQVQDMTCGHCVKTLTAALQAVDAQAVLAFDLPAHTVRVESGHASAAVLREAMVSAGFAATLSTSAPLPDAQPGTTGAR